MAYYSPNFSGGQFPSAVLVSGATRGDTKAVFSLQQSSLSLSVHHRQHREARAIWGMGSSGYKRSFFFPNMPEGGEHFLSSFLRRGKAERVHF